MLLNRFINSFRRSSVPVFIFSTPRSGTTLFTELLEQHPRLHIVREIFIGLPARRKVWETYFPYQPRYHSTQHAYWSGIKHYVNDILRHQYFGPSVNLWSRKLKRVISHNILLSFRANTLAIDLTLHFKAKAIVLVRHPIAVALSKKRNNWKEKEMFDRQGSKPFAEIAYYLEDEAYVNQYLNKLQRKKAWEVYRKTDNDLEKYVLIWLLDNIPLLHFCDKEPNLFKVLRYENLVSNQTRSLKEIGVFLGVSNLDQNVSKQCASASSYMSDKKTLEAIKAGDLHSLLNGWQKAFTISEKEELLTLMRLFNCPLYT